MSLYGIFLEFLVPEGTQKNWRKSVHRWERFAPWEVRSDADLRNIFYGTM